MGGRVERHRAGGPLKKPPGLCARMVLEVTEPDALLIPMRIEAILAPDALYVRCTSEVVVVPTAGRFATFIHVVRDHGKPFS